MSGDRWIVASGLSCIESFLLDGAFNSHLILTGISRVGECSLTVESGVVVVVLVAVREGLKIGTKADLTTSMCSSSESSDDECDECSLVEFSSTDELILLFGVS